MKISHKKLLILFFCFSFFQPSLKAQPPSFGWVRAIGSGANTFGIAKMLLDSNKAVVATGLFSSTLDIDAGSGTFNLTSNGNQDIFVTKYTTNGNFVWAKSIGGSFDDAVMDLKKDRQGNLYLVGFYQGTVDFDPGPGVSNLTTSGFTNTFILKLDKDANFLWVKGIVGRGNTLDIDEDGNILIGGDFGATVDFDPGPGLFNMTANLTTYRDMFVMKLNNSGDFLWAKQIRNLGLSDYQQFGLETDPSGNVFFAGNFTNTSDFDPGPASVALSSNGLDDAFILKLNAQGDYMWVKQFGSTEGDKPFALEVDRQGNVFSTGEFRGTVDFDPDVAAFPLTSPTTGRCCFISKLDGAGNFVYAKNFQSGETVGMSLTIDSSNNLYISGFSGGVQNTVDFDPGPGTYNITGSVLFTVKLDPVGGFMWAAGYSPTVVGLNFESKSTVLVDQFNSVYLGGSFTGTVDFDPGPGSFIVSTGAYGVPQLYLHKLGLAPCNNSTTKVINAQACGNYALNGVNYNSSGQYYQLLTNTASCDSIIQLNLLISSVQTNLVQTSCGPLVWNGQTLRSSGNYRDTIRLSNGCDSIIILSLTVNTRPVPNLGRDTVICISDTVRLSAGTFASYLWNNGSTSSSIAVTQPGIYWVNVTATNGCSVRDSLTIALSGNCLPCADPNLIEKIYPTPFNRILTVKIKSSVCELNMDIFNAIGQLIIKGSRLQSGTNTINMEKFPASTYFYKIYNGKTILAEGKILKL